LHKRYQQRTRERAFGSAIAEVLASKIGAGIKFFVALPTVVDQYHVYTAIGIPAAMLLETPKLESTVGPDGRSKVTGSLAQGAVSELLRACTRELREPDPGTGLGLGVEPGDVARSAGEALTASAVALAGNVYGPPFYDAINKLSTTRYEQRIGIGRLVVASPDSTFVDRALTLREPVHVTETRTLRKLLETSSSRGASLLVDGAKAYGLGQVHDDYDPISESVFEVSVMGHGNWDLRHAGIQLMTVENGAPRLPQQRLSREKFEDVAGRVFAPSVGCDTDALWDLAMAAADAEHGTMLVVSATAAIEAERLGHQALTVDPAPLPVPIVRQVARIDGAILVDPSGACHAVGVILDGTADGEGDRARGARYNSAVRYLSSRAGTMIILVSEDGMINLLPDLRPLMRRSDMETRMADLRAAAAADPVDPSAFSKAYGRVKAAAFYLSPEQCAEANELREEHWERRMAAGAQIRIYDSPLAPNPEMSDAYWAD
jgi:hypothetical protein